MKRSQLSKDFKGSTPDGSMDRDQNPGKAVRSSSMTTNDQTIGSDVRDQYKEEPQELPLSDQYYQNVNWAKAVD